MHLWSGPATKFVQDSIQNRVVQDLESAWMAHYRYPTPRSEVQAWRNSLRAMSQVVQHASLETNGILLEYQLPLASKRLDCMLTGLDEAGSEQACIVELKQWERAQVSEGDYVMTVLGGGIRETLHPSAQALGYRLYLEGMHTAFHGADAVALSSCAYLHNYRFEDNDALLDDRYAGFQARSPLFSENDVDKLVSYIRKRVGEGEGLPILDRVVNAPFRPSKKLMDHVANVIQGRPEYNLLDEQLVVFDKINTLLKARPKAQSAVVIIKGGPGTGKSVIAINMMAQALKNGFNTHYATGSKAFTETLRKVIGKQGQGLFTYFNSYGNAPPGQIDLLVLDEAHRIRNTSNSMYTPKAKRTEIPQVEELLKATKVAAFFIDDHQVVRPNEIGSVGYLRESARKMGSEVHEYQLDIQFRCGGSDAFVNWIESTLGVRKTPNILWEGHRDFTFEIMDTPQAVESAIRKRVKEGNTGRVVAGFCWKWNLPNADGTLPLDVVIPEHDYRRPWDAHYNAKKLAPGIPKASLWAYDANGIDQVGCVYTAQGFEFDYVGVIFGKDLRYDPKAGTWIGDPSESADSVVKRSEARFVDLVKNTYRVLLSRGMKGCYVYFQDEATRNFFQSRIETST
jgi:uncharacterized protein